VSEIAVLLLTHRWDRFVQLKFERLRAEIGDLADVALLLQRSDGLEALGQTPDRSAWIFDPAQLPRQLGFPFMNGRSVVPGSTHFPVMAFARQAPRYAHYLVIEFDVEFSGNWRDLAAAVAVAAPDFASLHFRTHDEIPAWYWWPYCRPAEADQDWAGDRRNLIKSFNPIYCLSRRALDLLEAAHRSGWSGHYELLLATILSRRGCRIFDLAELGFCAGREQNARPDLPDGELSTVRWRPDVTSEEFDRRSTGQTLFHPVKGGWLYDGSRIVTLDPASSGE
jgi:hypothetical protein